MLKPFAVSLTMLAVAVPAAGAQGPYVPPPTTAERMTKELVQNIAWHKAFKERRATEDDWPTGVTVDVSGCEVKTRRVGTCLYTLSHVDYLPGEIRSRSCKRRVTTTIAKRTHRIKTRVRRYACEETTRS